MIKDRYTLDEINDMEIIRTEHYANLIVEKQGTRIWISLMTIADGMPYDNQVTIEKMIFGQWRTVETYEAK